MARLMETAVWLADREPAPRRHRLYSPGAVAALLAVKRLKTVPKESVVFAVTASLGPMVAAFDKAWQAADGGPLVGPGFADNRARRIHPFTLLKALDNQVPACFAAEMGLQGPCRHFHDSRGIWPVLAANIDSAEASGRPVLVVAVDVRSGDEAVTRRAYQNRDRDRGSEEGAVCLLLAPGSGDWMPSDVPTDGFAFETALAIVRACSGV